MPAPLRRLLTAAILCCALLAGVTACGGDDNDTATSTANASGTPTATSSAQQQKYAKARFVANAGLAAGATYQWIVKPYRAGKFKKGADGRRVALIKAAAAGAFSYNRLKAASVNAKGDPALAKAVAPLTAGIAALKDLPSKLRKGDSTDSVVGTFDDIVSEVKEAGKDAGAEVTNKVPSASQLTGS